MRFLVLLFPLTLLAAELQPESCPPPIPRVEEMRVDLRNPTYKNGILYTNQGGVIQNSDIRIQARSIQYVRKDGVHKIEAEGDLLIQYKGRVYVGSEIEYDFEKKSGVVHEGKTFSSIWYVGGDKIQLNPDGSYKVTNAFITTCENADSTWDLHASRVNVMKGDLVEAKKVRFRLFKIPAMWLPSFKVNLKKFKEPIFRYSVNWDKGQGPRAMIRYQFYSWKDFAMYGRVEYRWRTGWGGAFETEYFPTDYKTTFVTRSYLATDRLENAPDKMRRYRVQGAFNNESRSGKTNTVLSWDKYSDVRMPGDFKSEDFEINTAKKTLFYVRHEEKNLIASLKLRPRVNGFESIKQDLPSVYTSARPLEIGRTGIYSTNVLKASYMDFVYSDQLVKDLSSYHSTRIEFREQLYRPIHFGAATLTPQAGLIGIFYGNSPSTNPKALGLFTYGARADVRAMKRYTRYKHHIEPYLEFTGLSAPTVQPDDHYIFTIQDGYHQINQLQGGIRNLLFSQKRKGKGPSFTADLFANAFFAEFQIPQVIPRLYLDLLWDIASLNFSVRSCWNYRNHTLDFTNARLKWTMSENAAFSLEGRYRSKFDWRKADHENFILDVTRTQSELLLSPLSDRRITFLTHLFIRPTPFWECHIRSHHGFYRKGEEPYNEIKVDLYTWLSSVIKLRISYAHVDKDDRVTAGISLVRK
jgi:hypothetical protein